MGAIGECIPCQSVIDLAKDVATLKRVVLEGNGAPSLVSRVTATETKLALITWLSGATFVGIVTLIVTIIAKHN
jgi:hypothetical protein